MLEKFEFVGKRKGKHLLVLAAVHGNETAGTEAIFRLMKEIKEQKICLCAGCLTVVPICNPDAYKKGIRQIDENLNRVMKIHGTPQTYEQMLANEICPLIKDSDMMLDLHSTHCKGDVPFVFCDYPSKENQQIIDVLPVNYVLEGWPNIYAGQVDIKDFSTEYMAHQYGHIGSTLECGFHKDKATIEIAYQSIVNVMAVLKMIEQPVLKMYPKQRIVMQNYVVKKSEGKFLKDYKHLDFVQKGENIAQYDNGEILLAPDDGYILLPNHQAKIGAEWFYFGKKASS